MLGLIGGPPKEESSGGYDPVLACPETKEPVRISASGPIFGGDSASGRKVTLMSSPTSDLTYSGRTDTYYNLLEPEKEDESSSTALSGTAVLDSLRVFIPPPVRSAMATAGILTSEDYVPMRDLFTSPSVSFAYERGWRQNFAMAGFPGADKEAEMVREYFQPATVGSGRTTVVDMSCATGLFTRRLAKSEEYDRVIGCDYSDSMLTEARKRIKSDRTLGRNLQRTQLDLVRCDVGNIPMQSGSVDALHAGAAMHCWPDLDSAMSEIHRVLKPGGRYFATTFLSSYFGTLQRAEGGQTGPSRQAFQYFESVDKLRDMMIKAGFDPEKVDIEVLGTACVVIRCEK